MLFCEFFASDLMINQESWRSLSKYDINNVPTFFQLSARIAVKWEKRSIISRQIRMRICNLYFNGFVWYAILKKVLRCDFEVSWLCFTFWWLNTVSIYDLLASHRRKLLNIPFWSFFRCIGSIICNWLLWLLTHRFFSLLASRCTLF